MKKHKCIIYTGFVDKAKDLLAEHNLSLEINCSDDALNKRHYFYVYDSDSYTKAAEQLLVREGIAYSA